MIGKTARDRCTASAAIATKGYNAMAEAKARYTRYLAGVRTRNRMKTYTFVAAVIMLIFFAYLSRVCV